MTTGGGLLPLASDMAAFKAANPGCVLADFVRWHSPRDFVPGAPEGLSPRMRAPGPNGGLNAWKRAWRQARPAPARAQGLGWRPRALAEAAVADLEALEPSQLWADFFASAASNELLAQRERGAALGLPALDEPLAAAEARLAGALGRGGGPPDARAAVRATRAARKAARSGESLLLRLGGHGALANAALAAALAPTPSTAPVEGESRRTWAAALVQSDRVGEEGRLRPEAWPAASLATWNVAVSEPAGRVRHRMRVIARGSQVRVSSLTTQAE